ncbi:HlyD family secretion protein [Vibrio mangrovi]|uniref:Efflux RND transporter periplasmic adaptor subunit n=1 Tax=Vibrio mangrovi TaxID=474394 RepID=A0A1Y6IZE4_9VIBR|nr:efflux RND transporter periplasmic adaptor subunit [Vibrio mangrovi]MDW6002902.1 efflux RND transporter periplasmic adaptor subunit [Vibrio mangrovi]SMS02391.1 Multidrug export protein EmrA [Vibrio mangrovi]
MENTQESQLAPSRGRKRKKGLIILASILIVIAALCYTWYVLFVAGHESTEDAYVDGNLVQVTPQIVGTVTQIFVDDGDYIHQGQPLVNFDPSDADIALQTAKANLAQTVRQVRSLFNNVEQAKAVVAQKQIDFSKAQTDYQRRKQMVEVGGLSQEELSHAKDEVDSAEKALTVSIQQLKSQEAMTYNTDVDSHPLVQSAAADFRQSYLNQQRTKLVAPVSGYIAKRSAQVGQRVNAGTALMTVVPLDQVWVEANFKETQMKEMRLGQPVTLVSDLYGDDTVFHGVVESLGIGTGSAFSLLPAQNATGNWIKVVQRLPVRIKLDQKELAAHPLRIGLSMKVVINTKNQKGQLLSESAHMLPHYQTDIYQVQMSGIMQTIKQIIQSNDIADQ